MAQNTYASREPALPPELLRSIPRNVGLTRVGFVAVLLAAVLVAGGIAGGALLYGRAVQDAADARSLPAESLTGSASVTRVGVQRGENRERTVDYRYRPGDREYSGRVKLRRREPLASRVAVGDVIAVHYLRTRPDRNWIEGHEPRPLPLWIGPLVAIGAALIGILAALSIRRQFWLLEQGHVALARVTGTSRMKQAYGRETRVEYEWTLPGGATRRGRSESHKPPAPGALVPLLYDPERTGRRALYPLCMVRVKEI